MFKDNEKDLMFYLYEYNNDEYRLLGSYKNMCDLLESKDIEKTAFSIIIIDDNTEFFEKQQIETCQNYIISLLMYVLKLLQLYQTAE